MNKINFQTIQNDVYDQLSIIPVPMITRLFEVGRSRTADEVFISIIEQVLLDFERYYPVKLTLKLPKVQCSKSEVKGSWVDTYYQDNPSSVIKFYDNSEQVFYNLLPESDLALIPLAVKRLQNSFGVSHPTDYRRFEYQIPYLYGVSVNSFRYYSGIFKYPIIKDMKNTNVVKLENTWMLLMPYGNDTWRTFKAACVVKVCDYILDLKENFDIPGVPINVFGALNKIRDRFDRLVQTEYSQALVSWGWD